MHEDWATRIRSKRVIHGWTQTQLAREMQKSSDEPLAKLASLVRSIKGWEAGDHDPDQLHQRVMTKLFEQSAPPAAVLESSDRELRTLDFVTHLAEQSGRPFGEVYGLVATRADSLANEPAPQRLERQHQQRSISCEQLTEAVIQHYDAGEQCYRINFAGTQLQLPILVRPEWFGMNVDLNSGRSGEFDPSAIGVVGPITDAMFTAAVERLADAEANDKVLYDNVIYRLVDIDVDDGRFTPRFGQARFADFALGCGLMESELAASLTTGSATPIRDSLLPSIDTATNFDSYVCAGGPVALFAVARPASGSRPADYALLIQVRGARVMDLSGRLSTIPKGWHEPASEIADQSDLRSTLLRELEEELLGAEELELITDESRRAADPLHLRARSAAMRPFLTQADGFHLRATGIGVNLLAGTFEAACLVTVNDESWWEQHGHSIGGNWESSKIEIYSSADGDGIERLLRDPRWVSEGLFSLVEGLRCLTEVGEPSRLDQRLLDLQPDP